MFASGWPLMPGSYLYPRPHPSGQEGGCEGPEVMAGHLPAGACHSWEFSGDPDGGTCCPGAPPPTHCWFQSPGALLGAPMTAPLVLPPSLEASSLDRVRGCGVFCPLRFRVSGGPGDTKLDVVRPALPPAWGRQGDQWIWATHPISLPTLPKPAPKGSPFSTPATGPLQATYWESPEFRSLKRPLGPLGLGPENHLDLVSP